MKIRIIHALLPVFMLGCTKPAQAPTTTAGVSSDDALGKALRTYVVEFLRRNPTTNTYLGGAGLDPSLKDVDGTLRDYFPAALQQEDQWLTDTAKTIESVAPGSLSARARIDRDVALAQIGFMLRQHMVRLYQQRALDTYVGEPFRAIDWQLQGMAQTGPNTYGTADEWRLLVSRVNAIPTFLGAARMQLEGGISASRVPDKRMLERDGINTSEANAKYFAETLTGVAAERIAGSERDELLAELRRAGKRASDAYLEMRDFVANTFFEGTKPSVVGPGGRMNSQRVKPTDRFAMGEVEYNWALKNNYVTPTHNDPAALKSNNRAALADLAAHEGFPGHDWYYKVLTQARDRVSPVRWLTPGAVEDSSSMWEDSMSAEGWGLYAEALMAEPQPGFPNGFYSPEEHLYQLQGQLYRDLRVRIDTGIHTGRMAYDDAVTLFSEVVDFLPGSCLDPGTADRAQRGADRGQRPAVSDAKRASCESAERAIFRYSKWPTQAITYRLGKDQIYALRKEAATALGDRFSPKTFHLLFIREGTIPPGYFHVTLLEQLRQLQK